MHGHELLLLACVGGGLLPVNPAQHTQHRHQDTAVQLRLPNAFRMRLLNSQRCQLAVWLACINGFIGYDRFPAWVVLRTPPRRVGNVQNT